MGSRLVFHIASFILYVLVQGLVLQNAVLFDQAFCFVYIAFLFCLPVDLGVLTLLLIGFTTGLGVDIFYDTLGMHAAASVLIMFVRNYWLNSITPQGGYDVGSAPSVNLNGGQWFIGYVFPLIVIHHIALFFIEASSFSLFWFTLGKVLMSSVFTVIVIMVVQYLFYYKSRR